MEGTVLQEQQFPEVKETCISGVGDGGRCRNPRKPGVKVCLAHFNGGQPLISPDIIELKFNIGKPWGNQDWLFNKIPLRKRSVQRSQLLATSRVEVAKLLGRASEVYRKGEEHVNEVPVSKVDDGTLVFQPYLPNVALPGFLSELSANGYFLLDAYRLLQEGQRIPVVKLAMVFSKDKNLKPTEGAMKFSYNIFSEFVASSVFGECYVWVNPRRPENHPSSYAGKIVHTVNLRCRKNESLTYRFFLLYSGGKWTYRS